MLPARSMDRYRDHCSQEALLINSCRKEMEELISEAQHLEAEAGVHAGAISTYHDQVNQNLCLLNMHW
jgi:hypothetical protein